MSIKNFINNKQEFIQNNENFKEWMADNKIFDENGNPIISFHGSVNQAFNVVDFDKSNKDWWVGKGFYTSNSISDVNANYATAEQEESSSYDRYKAPDLNQRIGNLEEILNDTFNIEEIIKFFDCEDIEEMIEDEEITLENAVLLKNGEWKDIAIKLADEDGIIEWSEFINKVVKNNFVDNEGWIHPVFIKMNNPVYYTFDKDSTFVQPSNLERETYKGTKDYLFDRFQEVTFALEDYFKKINDNETSNAFTEKEFNEHIIRHFGTYRECNTNEVIDELMDYIDRHELELDVDIDLENIEIIVKKLFVENELGDWEDEEEYVIDNDGLCAFFELQDDIEYNAPFKELYKKIKDRCLETAYDVDTLTSNKMEDFFYEVEMGILNEEEETTFDREDDGIRLYDIFGKARNAEEVEITDVFNKVISEIFDGVVLNAKEASKHWGMKNISDSTRHYIVFDENNVKSAIGNNGKYSLYDNNMCARRSREQKQEEEKENINNLMLNLKKYQEQYKENIDIHFENAIKYFPDNEDAVYDRDHKKVYVNMQQIKTSKELSKVITHEVLGHAGLDLVLGKNKNTFLEKVSNKYTEKDYKEVKQLYPELNYKNKNDRLKLTEEKICIYAENNYKYDKYMNKVVNFIKDKTIKFKKALGFKTKVEDDIFSIIHFINLKLNKNNLNKKKRKLT
jgi:hypothetical protein